MKSVVFTEDFATKKKGEVFKCDSQLASQLVNIDKVAKYESAKEVTEVTEAKEPKPKSTKK